LPAGHASSALWLVALAVYWLPDRPSAARLAAAAAIVFGAVVGFLQQLRGAHFLTHTLWSVWIACAIVLAAVVVLQAANGRVGAAQAMGDSTNIEARESDFSEAV
jgi:membrane-associated PAP2 superfamily phosphatase